ncbi:putrescine-binding periplasmic protein [Aliidongia dinghuensis]|uniref:Putrescine-binding periplasmic protein n=1 Tax=Aliidongia dinghuensis TaxID=1867774 RepID=A0A8J2YPJ0_9PROT|nr:extracellular solute-binding protein [Aliidongia dinghuensis]GGF03271.1 putrescine-binding periplasmic protein [Aliidongia dinghuensis]
MLVRACVIAVGLMAAGFGLAGFGLAGFASPLAVRADLPRIVAADDTTPVLNFANRPDYLADDTIQKFEAETGIKINLTTYTTDDELLAGLKSGKGDWDLVVAPAVPVLGKGIADGLFQPIDRTKIGNYANVDPAILDRVAPIDAGNRMGVPFLFGTAGLAVNLAKLKDALGEDPPTDTLGLLFDPALNKKAATCGLAIQDSPDDAIPAALAFLGLDPTSQDDKDLARAGELLQRVKPLVRRFAANDLTEALAGGSVCVGFGSSIQVTDAKTRASDRDNGVDLTYTVPRERARLWIDVLAIPAKAKNVEAAQQFINFLLRPEIVSDITDWTGAANPNLLAADFVDDDDKSDETVFPSQTSWARLFLDRLHTPEAEKTRARIWARSKP